MDAQLREEVWRRASGRCEYCHFPSDCAELDFQIDHVIARKHGGSTESANLALACFYCNSHKGPNIAGVDPVSQEIVTLFHPRRDSWLKHFRWHGPLLEGCTPSGRATIAVLRINDTEAIAVREALVAEGKPRAEG